MPRPKPKNLERLKFGKLTAVNLAPRDLWKKKGAACWVCLCDCGKEVTVQTWALVNGASKSCGCYFQPKRFEGMSTKWWNRIVVSCSKTGREFSITKEYAIELFLKQNGKCALSGVAISFGKKDYVRKGKYLKYQAVVIEDRTASIDRIDSSKGYIEGNIQWVHKKVNVMKMDLPQGIFIDWCRKIASLNQK